MTWGPLATIATTEAMERFSFYGMRALLVLYLIAGVQATDPGLGVSEGDAFAIYGAYLSLVYLTPLAGGFVADRFFGARRTVLAGGVLIAAGHFVMAIPATAAFFTGLLVIAVGTGALKPNISAMVAHIDPSPARRDANFSVLYLAINVGSFAAPLVSGWAASLFGWHVAFMIAGVAMSGALVVYVAGWRTLTGLGDAPRQRAPWSLLVVACVGVLAAVGVFVAAVFAHGYVTGRAVSPSLVAQDLTVVLVAVAVVMLTRLVRAKGLSRTERSRVRAFVFVFAAAVVFFLIFDQAGSVLNVFAEKSVELGVVPASALQSVNPLFIIIFAPIFAAVWLRLGQRAPSVPTRFAFALVGVGLSYLVMIVPSAAAADGRSSAVTWLLGVYLLQTWAELLLSPVGLSASTHLAPAGQVSQVVALWFLAVAVGDSLGGQVASLTAAWPQPVFFAVTGAVAVLAGLAALPASRRLAAAMR